jgi:hypothetical protein
MVIPQEVQNAVDQQDLYLFAEGVVASPRLSCSRLNRDHYIA